MAGVLNDEVLPTNSTDRLIAVADQIQRMPSLFDMDSFFGYDEFVSSSLEDNVGIGHNCNTTACIAGWAIRFTPSARRYSADGMILLAGESLGLSHGLAATLFFMYGLNNHNRLVADILRAIATIPEGERNIVNVETVMPRLPTQELRSEWAELREIYISLDEEDEDEG